MKRSPTRQCLRIVNAAGARRCADAMPRVATSCHMKTLLYCLIAAMVSAAAGAAGALRQHAPEHLCARHKYFTGEVRLDANYVFDFNRPKDHTIVGSSEIGRANELVVQQLGVGGDFHYEHVRGRLMTQIGLYSTMTPRNDASPARGQWNLSDAYRYLSEAYGGYAEFLRWTETADHYDRVNQLVNIALKLNPDNLEAKAAGEDIKFSFKHV